MSCEHPFCCSQRRQCPQPRGKPQNPTQLFSFPPVSGDVPTRTVRLAPPRRPHGLPPLGGVLSASAGDHDPSAGGELQLRVHGGGIRQGGETIPNQSGEPGRCPIVEPSASTGGGVVGGNTVDSGLGWGQRSGPELHLHLLCHWRPSWGPMVPHFPSGCQFETETWFTPNRLTSYETDLENLT